MFKKSILFLTTACLCFSVVGCSTTASTTPSPEPTPTPTVEVTQETKPRTLHNIAFDVPASWRYEFTNDINYFYPTETNDQFLSIELNDYSKATFSEQDKTDYFAGLATGMPDFKQTNIKDVTISGLSGFNFTATATIAEAMRSLNGTIFSDGANIYAFTFASTGLEASPYAADAQKAVDSIKFTAPTPTATPTPEQPKIKSYPAGMYKVGTDLPAGEYLLVATSSAYMSVTKDSSGTLDSIVSNENFDSYHYQTVKDGQYLELKRCGALLASDSKKLIPDNGIYAPGMYKVGKDIEPGEYKVKAISDSGYTAILRDSKGTLDSIVANDNFKGEKYITIKKGQYIKLSRCQLMAKK